MPKPPKRRLPPTIHDRCLAVRMASGHTLVCQKSLGHADSIDPKRRQHYDSDKEEYWDEES